MSGIAVLLFLTLFVPAGSAWSGQTEKELSKKEKELESVKKKIEGEKKSIKEASLKEVSVLDELGQADKKLVSIKGELFNIAAGFKKIDDGMKKTADRIALLSKEGVVLRQRLESRLRAIYMIRSDAAGRPKLPLSTPSKAWVEVVFSAPTLEEFDRRQKYLTLIMEADSRLIERLDNNISFLGAEKTKQERLKMENESLRIAHLDKKREVEKTVAQKKKFLNEIKNKKQTREKLLSELGSAENELESLIEQLRKESEMAEAGDGKEGFGAMRGKLGMPVDGEVVSFYGEVRHPKFNTVTFNNGVVIKAPFGAAVKNIYEGKVVFAGWLKGYGQVMIVEHTGGWYTLFGRLYKELKAVGEVVSPDEAIALVGEGGLGEGPGLYFEVRHKGSAKNPLKWFVSRQP
ncbi:MAG: peptidoglycan DD-metalloendopeptidase family protein [Deltaproteobacteria bacterium]|nr:peptidoglycan DD-metalloendopeptidase family protein [Deltaproteobacteria bacterium]